MGMEKRRFLFDTNNFDDGAPEVGAPIEENVPAPIMYSEDEMSFAKESAQEAGFQKGRKEGFRESEESLSGQIHSVCDTLSKNIKTLLSEEVARSESFKNDVHQLFKGALEAALPDLMVHGDFDASLQFIHDTLVNYGHVGRLKIQVPSEYVESLQAYFVKNLPDDEYSKLEFEAISQKSQEGEGGNLSPVSISWEHGGAVRDPELLKENILDVLKQALAQEPLNPQNEESNKSETDDE